MKMANELIWGVVLALFYVTLRVFTKKKGPKATLIGPYGLVAHAGYVANAGKLVCAGYEKSKETLFKIWTPFGYLHILPAFYIQELRKVADDCIDFAFVDIGTMPEYTGVHLPECGFQAIKQDLTRNLNAILPHLNEEVKSSFSKLIPPCTDWTPINTFQTIIRMTAIISTCVVSGHELAQNPKWIDTSVSYNTDVLKAVGKLRLAPRILRPFVVHFIPEMKHIKRHYEIAKTLLDPVLKWRAEEAKTPGYVKPNDILQWVTDRMASEGLDYDQGVIQLSLGLGSIHTTAITTIQIIYELAARPDEYNMLREEIMEAIGTSESMSIDKDALTKLRKLDSFMKEVHRLHPMNHVTWLGKITNPVTVGDVHFTAGTLISIPSRARAIDPTNWPDPMKFDALRFYKMRQRSEADSNLHQFASIPSDASMAPFGFGRSACPGRFLASQQIKVLLAYLIMNYDLRVHSEKERSHERPPNLEVGLAIVPDPKVSIEFKQRTSQSASE